MPTKGGRKEHKEAKAPEQVQRRQRFTLLAVIGAVVLVFGSLVAMDRAGVFAPQGGDPCKSVEGGAVIHEHARLFLYLDSQAPFDFSPPKYQVQASFVHFENGVQDSNGATIHIHQVRPTLRCVLSTVHFQVDGNGNLETDTGQEFKLDKYDVSVTFNGRSAGEGLNEPVIGCDSPCNTYVVRYTPKDDSSPPPPPPPGNDTGPGNGTLARDE